MTYWSCLSEPLNFRCKEMVKSRAVLRAKGTSWTELNWARMGQSDGHLLITRLRKTAVVGLRLRRLKSKCPPGNQPGFATKRSIEMYFRTIILQNSSNFGRKKKMLRFRGWNSCHIRVPSFEFPARMLPVLPEISPGSSSIHLESCTGSLIHTLSVYHSLLAIRRAGAVH